MSKVTNYGIIGCGMMGNEHMRNIALLPDAEVAVVYEPDAGMRQAAQHVEPDVAFADSIEELLAFEGLDCVLIASPNFRHVEQLELLAQKRALPVLVEKPLFTDPKDVARMDAFIANYPAPVWVAMEYRYMPPIAAFLEATQDATGGIKMLTIREHRFPFLPKVGNWNRFNAKSGGTFVEKCCHFFDLMRLTLGAEPVRVMASGGQDVNHLTETYDGAASDIQDNGYVIVDFDNGARAMLELCMFAEGAEYQEEVAAVGPKGKVEALVPGPGRFWPAHLGDAPVPKLVLSPRHPKGPEVRDIPVDEDILEAGDHNGSTFYQHQKFLELVRGELSMPEVSFNDGKLAVLMGMAAQLSIAEKRVVEMSELL